MWYWIVGAIVITLIGCCAGGRYSMKYAWQKRKEELEDLNKQLEEMAELTEDLKKQKAEIEQLLSYEFKDFDALFKQKKNID